LPEPAPAPVLLLESELEQAASSARLAMPKNFKFIAGFLSGKTKLCAVR
jgi:hypothetical protein